MTTGRKPREGAQIIDAHPDIDQSRVDNAMTVMRKDAQAEQQEAMTGVFALGRLVGAAQMAGSIAAISAVAEVRAFEEINKSKDFSHLPNLNINGEFRRARNIDEFCRAVFGGRGYKAMMDRKAMLEHLGDGMYESVSRLGLNRTQLRLLINLPEDTRSAVEEAMQFGDKSEVVTLIQSLANQLDEAKGKAEELKAEVAAKEDLLATRSKQIDALDQKLARVKTLPQDEVLAELHAEAAKHYNDALGAVKGNFSAAIAALAEHRDTGGADSTLLMAGMVADIQRELNDLRERFGLPDTAADAVPDWVGNPEFDKFAPDAGQAE